MPYVDNKTLRTDDGKEMATFDSHWQGVAALLRLSDPSFRSLGGDSDKALATERLMKSREQVLLFR